MAQSTNHRHLVLKNNWQPLFLVRTLPLVSVPCVHNHSVNSMKVFTEIDNRDEILFCPRISLNLNWQLCYKKRESCTLNLRKRKQTGE